MPSTPTAYRVLLRIASALVPIAAPLSEKLARGHAGRRAALTRLTAWGRAHRDRVRPLAWFHAASVGEGLQAAAIIERLRARQPGWQLAFTHFSSSAERLAASLPVDVAGYLPYDLPAAADTLLDSLAPDALVFVKLDLWPELATRASARGVAVALAAGTVSPLSSRLRWPARALQRAGYAALAAAAAIAEEDGGRLERLGVLPDRISALGDPRCDSVCAAVTAVRVDDPLLAYGRGAPTMVAGSTWPSDEAVVMEAFAEVRRRHPEARLILVPHEPTSAHLAAVEGHARRLGLPHPVRLSAAASPVPLLLVDRVGVLAALYGGGTMAFVGGAFSRTGLHSVLEPAAWGLPVAFGPSWEDSREAGLLLSAGAAVTLPPRERGAGTALARAWVGWIEDEAGRAASGARALEVVRAGRGAADRNAAMVEELVRAARGARKSAAG